MFARVHRIVSGHDEHSWQENLHRENGTGQEGQKYGRADDEPPFSNRTGSGAHFHVSIGSATVSSIVVTLVSGGTKTWATSHRPSDSARRGFSCRSGDRWSPHAS